MQTNNKARVLLVDDEPTNLQALGNLLKTDYHIQVAPNGEKAIALAQTDPQPDLILLDVQMPGITGYEVCRQLKELPETNTIPIIFVTARNNVEDEEKGFRLGAVDYISKPFYPTIVRARVGTHLSLKKKTDMLEQIAMQDGLTGIANRRAFDNHFEDECRRAGRHSHDLSVLMLDIDHFKGFNDHYGHGIGDACLRRVAQAVASAESRPGDLAARYGGEEFVVVLPETDVKGAVVVAEKIRTQIEQLAIPHEFSSVANVVTVSIGVATCLCADPDNDQHNLLTHADEALYAAKQRGRNQVQVYHSDKTG